MTQQIPKGRMLHVPKCSESFDNSMKSQIFVNIRGVAKGILKFNTRGDLLFPFKIRTPIIVFLKHPSSSYGKKYGKKYAFLVRNGGRRCWWAVASEAEQPQ